MVITRDIEITKKKTNNGEIVLDYYGATFSSYHDLNNGNPSDEDMAMEASLKALYREMMRYDENQRFDKFKKFLAYDDNAVLNEKLKGIKDAAVADEPVDVRLERGLDNLIKFFSEFSASPSVRFVNTLLYKLHSTNKVNDNTKAAKEYIMNYFALSGSQYANDIKAKMKSDEFNDILNDISVKEPTNRVNSRISFLFGPPGTGKTYNAMKEAENKCIVCHSGMLESDIMENFCFVDGKPGFEKSDLWLAMENGTKIVLDEINLLSFQVLRFLQGVTDNKSEFEYKGQTVHIKEGFHIIGTLNLDIGGMTYGLPEPLVDRASDIQEYKLTGKQLAALL